MKRSANREAQLRALKRTKDADRDNLSSSEDEAEAIVQEEAGDEEFINDGDLTREKIEIEEQEEEELRIHQILKRAQKQKESKTSNMFSRSTNPRLFSKKKVEKVQPQVEEAERQALAELANQSEVVGFTKQEEYQNKYNIPAKLTATKNTTPISKEFKPNLGIDAKRDMDPQLLEVLADCEEEEKEEAKRIEEQHHQRMADYAKNQHKAATPQKVERTRPLSTTPIKEQSQTVQKTAPSAGASTFEGAAAPVEVFKNEDGSIPFYWYDAHEIPNDRKGEIFLFGKVLDRKTGRHASATVVVKGLQRVYYAVPRGSQRLREIEDKGEGDEPEINGMKIYEEIQQIRRSRYPGIHEWKCKMVSRNYAFELPLPHAHPIQCLKIKYDARYPPLMDTYGKSFEYMFGVNGSLLEDFLLKRKIMGPCWLRVYNPVIKHVRSGGPYTPHPTPQSRWVYCPSQSLPGYKLILIANSFLAEGVFGNLAYILISDLCDRQSQGSLLLAEVRCIPLAKKAIALGEKTGKPTAKISRRKLACYWQILGQKSPGLRALLSFLAFLNTGCIA